MKFKISQKHILLLALSCTLFFSCKKDDEDDETLNEKPEEIIDKDHVVLNDRYGITATFPIDQWTNTYMDTMPADKNSYFDGFRYNAICASLLCDNMSEEGDTIPRYATSIYFMRFHDSIPGQTACDEFIKTYKKKMYDDLKGVYYEQVTEITDTIIGKSAYETKHFVATRGYSLKPGMEDVYLIYQNQRLYGVNIKIDKDLEEESLKKCTDILETISIK